MPESASGPGPAPLRWQALLLCLCAASASADSLAPFTSDGCSLFPDGTLSQQNLWLDCCIQHDLDYWKGGTRAERLAADKALERCVETVGAPEIAALMHSGVRAGGSPWWPTGYHWGYGWPYLRGYKALDRAERAEVRLRLHELEQRLQRLGQLLEQQSTP